MLCGTVYKLRATATRMDGTEKKRHLEVVDRIFRETIQLLRFRAQQGDGTSGVAQVFANTIIQAYASGIQQTGGLPAAEMAQLSAYLNTQLESKIAEREKANQ